MAYPILFWGAPIAVAVGTAIARVIWKLRENYLHKDYQETVASSLHGAERNMGDNIEKICEEHGVHPEVSRALKLTMRNTFDSVNNEIKSKAENAIKDNEKIMDNIIEKTKEKIFGQSDNAHKSPPPDVQKNST